MENKNPFPLSHSRRSAFDCGFYFANEYQDQIRKFLGLPTIEMKPKAVGIPAECGRFGHFVLEQYQGWILKEKRQAMPEKMKEIIRPIWEGLPTPPPETEYDDMESCLTRFAESHLFNPAQIYGVEMRLALRKEKPKCGPPQNAHKLDERQTGLMKDFMLFVMGHDINQCDWNDPSVWFRGIIDLCETPDPETVIITDYKFSWAAKAKWELQKGLQGRIYAWLMSLVNPGAKTFIVRFDYVRKGIMVELEYTREDCEKMGERIQRIADKVERAITERGADVENWPASLCSNCAWCQYPCPLAQNSMQLSRIIKQHEDAKQLGSLILMQRQTLEKNQAIMKEYTKQEKPVTVGGQVFGYHVTEKETYDAKEAYRVLFQAGHDPYEVLEVNTHKLNAKKRARIKEAIADLAEVKTSQRYGIKKQEGGDE